MRKKSVPEKSGRVKKPANVFFSAGRDLCDLNEKSILEISGVLLDLLKKLEKYKYDLSFSLSLVSDRRIRDLNREHRKKNSVTDVLSFPQWEDPAKARIPGGELFLGDIVISTAVCRRQARQIGHSVPDEFLRLLTHGLLHLCGYDHEISLPEEKRMQKREDRLLAELSRSGY